MSLLRINFCIPSFLIARIIVLISLLIARDFYDFFYLGFIWCFSPFWVASFFYFSEKNLKFEKNHKCQNSVKFEILY